MELRPQTMVDVVPISIAPTPSLLHHNNVRVTYAKTSNFKMEPVRSVPLYYVTMLKSMITIIETPFVTTQIHTIVGMRFIPQTPRGIELVSMHEEMPREVNGVFAN